MRGARVAALLLAGACAPRVAVRPPDWPTLSSGVVHEVKKGQTLWRIARAYGVELQELAEANDITDPAQIAVGQKLFVPGAQLLLEVPPAPSLVGGGDGAPPPEGAGRGVARPEEPEPPAPKIERSARFAWPLKGVLYSRFGVRDGVPHDGIDIAAPEGTEVRAAAPGTVVYAGDRSGYGKLLIVDHADGFVTVYAHNRDNLAGEGDRVGTGQVIARVGRTGNATGPHLHFEVREGARPRNPTFYLP
jgi:murein DD-endopeptidase MepM/ murein hydrolase activator NlpD